MKLNNKEFANSVEALQYAFKVAKEVKQLSGVNFGEDNFSFSNDNNFARVWFHAVVLRVSYRLEINDNGIGILHWEDGKGWTGKHPVELVVG